jgi:hypothetical protein
VRAGFAFLIITCSAPSTVIAQTQQPVPNPPAAPAVFTAIPLIVAVLSFIVSIAAYYLSNKLATRSLFLEGQKFVLEIDRQLLSDPHLWGLYDDRDLNPPDTDPKFDPDARYFQAKLRAFAYLHLNMFEVILTEASGPVARRRRMSKVWLAYFRDRGAS